MKRVSLLVFSFYLLLSLASCSREESETSLYQQYAVRPDLTVAQVSGFHLNDTVKIDVVILVADDCAAWLGLKEEFDIRTSEGVTSWLGDIDEPASRVKRNQMPLWRAMAVHDERIVAFYRVESPVQFDALREYQLTGMTDNK